MARPRTKPVKPNPGRKSTISRHPDRVSIEMARVAGVSLDRVAEKYGVSRYAVHRHMQALSPDYKAALGAGVPIEELVERAGREGGTLMDNLVAVRLIIMDRLKAAAACNDSHAVANLARVSVEVNKELGRLTGEILKTPSITNITNNALVFMASPFMATLESMLVRRLTPFPDALREVVAGLDEIQRMAPVIPHEEAAFAA